jgi:Cu2+-containing amine oxidase
MAGHNSGLGPRCSVYATSAWLLPDTFLSERGTYSTVLIMIVGCDCLGVIAYLSGHVINAHGEFVAKNNCICIHEVDAGIQWKHTNHRTGKASVVRKRQLQLQTIITVANYEVGLGR